jgi:hypothetical protein
MKNHPLVIADLTVDDQRFPERADIDIGSIYVYKVLPGGKPVLWSNRLAAHELTSLEQLRERFGGGHWELKFRAADDSGIVAISRFEIAGPEKDASGNPIGQNGGAVQQTNQVEQMMQRMLTMSQMGATQAAPPGGGLMNSGVLALVVPAVLAYLSEMAKARASQEIATQQMMGALAQNQSAGQVALIQALMGKSSGENNGLALQESFMKGLDAMGTIIGKVKAGEAPDGSGAKTDWMEVIGTMIQNLRETMQAGASALQVVNGAPVPTGPAMPPLAPNVQTINNGA